VDTKINEFFCVLIVVNLSIDSVMDNIIEPSYNFDFSKLSLAQPTAIQGGAHFTKLLMHGKQLYIQSPKCTTRQGFIKTGKKIHCDLMFNNNDEEFIHWIESLETKCQELLLHKSTEWFQSPLEMTDIEAAFNSPLKVYKSGKFYLVRTNVKVNTLTGQPLIKIYNENEAPVQMEDVNTETNIISILEIQGIKFTSRNFQIDIEVKQVMLLNKDIIFENCLIKKNKDANSNTLPATSLALNFPLLMSNKMVENDKSVNLAENPILAKTSADNLEEMEEIILDETEIKEDAGGEDIKEDEEDEDDEEDEEDVEAKNETYEIKLEIEQPNMNLEITDTPTPSTNKNDVLSEDDLVDSILESMEPSNELTEFNIDLHLDNTSKDTIELKKPERVYYEMYQSVREKAKKAKQEAMLAYLEAKNIKKTYMLDNLSDSSEDSMDDISDTGDE
jgi:hypothetical protein